LRTAVGFLTVLYHCQLPSFAAADVGREVCDTVTPTLPLFASVSWSISTTRSEKVLLDCTFRFVPSPIISQFDGQGESVALG